VAKPLYAVGMSKDADAPLMLSVSGARGIVGRSITPALVADFAAAYGTWLRERARDPAPPVCVGRDSRPSGHMLAAAAEAGLAATGCRVVQLGVVSTPTVGLMIGQMQAAGGLVITASHNPLQWNGLKFLDADGAAPAVDEAEVILARCRQRRIDYATVDELHPVACGAEPNECHVRRVLDAVDPEPIRARGFHVVLDSVHGAGGPAGRLLLERLGCSVTHLYGEPTGRFPHVPEPLEENLGELTRKTASHHADAGFAQDPDADRLAVVDERGRYLGEEYTLALAARCMLGRRGPGTLVANLSTSRMIDDLAEAAGAHVIRTPVGEANVARAMREHGAIIGGEGNGGVILPAVCWVRDSLSAMALVLSLMAGDARPLSAIAAELPRYRMVKRKLDLHSVGGPDALGSVLQRVERAYRGARIDRADGLRLDLEDGWVHLRPSNTEPIVRVIAEASGDDRAAELADEVMGTLRD
jgi:phosphomannomutase